MAPARLEGWLGTEGGRPQAREGQESLGHRSGRRMVGILRKRKDDLTDADFEHVRKVIVYVRRHEAQRPSGDVEDTPWRHNLMNWGHDPLA